MGEEEQQLQDRRVYLSRQHYVTIGVLVAIILWVIGTTGFLIDKFEITPLRQKVQGSEQEIANARLENKALSTELQNIKHAYKNLLTEFDTPVALEPSEGATVVGKQLTFRWDYKHHEPYQKYILEIRPVSNTDNEIYRFNVLNPEQKLMHIHRSERTRFPVGEYLWRIVPGQLSDKEIVQGPASNYRLFTVYDTIVDRIRKTKTVRVGSYPTFTGIFHYQDGQGSRGFDIDLINWIVRKLPDKFQIEKDLTPQMIAYSWPDLLPALKKHEIDLVISSITSTKEREGEYNIRFTDGYFVSHQIFIRKRPEGEFPNELAGKRVGVSQNTTNEKAARLLENQFRFKLDNAYQSYDDLYEALEQDKIDFALVDDILVRNVLGQRFYQFGQILDEYLIEFYKTVIGRQQEMYAIAVAQEAPTEPQLLTMINEILRSKEGQEKLNELIAKWVVGK